MSERYKSYDISKPYFISFSTVNWIDLFTREEYKRVVLESLMYCQQNKGLNLHAWCLMTNHLHLIAGTSGKELHNIIRDFKSFTSRALKEAIAVHRRESRKEWLTYAFENTGKRNSHNYNWQLWQQNYHPIVLYSRWVMKQKLDYLHWNPVKAGFVSEPHHWIYSSALDYAGVKGLLEIIKL